MAEQEMGDLLAAFSYDKGEELPCNQWGQLEEGHYVMIQRDGEAIHTGEVDARTKDGSVFWVWLDGGRGRIAVYPDEGTCVWLPKGYSLEVSEKTVEADLQAEAPEQPEA